jgi:SAM-dependent methyltransferase
MGPTIAPTGFWAGSDAHLHHMWSPTLAAWIAEDLKGQELAPVYDFGCGMGHYMRFLRERGFQFVTGVEGDPPERAVCPGIVKHDLTQPYEVGEKGNVVCLEVAEHVPAFYEDTLLATITNAVEPGRSLILSWAVRGQGGDGHVNCRDNREVVHLICRRDFVWDEGASLAARAVVTDLEWFRNTVLIFRRAG